jgi:hypothetical protein
MVKVSNQHKSNHTTKQAAKNAARGYAHDGDELVIHRSDGTFQESTTVRNASASDDDESRQGDRFGLGTYNTGLGFD